MEDKNKYFIDLTAHVETIISGQGDRGPKLQQICDYLKEKVEYFDWVGFYLVTDNGNELELGPFAGSPTDHVCIPFGKGICGQAAEKKRTLIIQDVEKENNYLSCSPDVKAEIVLPLFKDEKIAGELDIDSHTAAPFTDQDRDFLEKICRSIERIL